MDYLSGMLHFLISSVQDFSQGQGKPSAPPLSASFEPVITTQSNIQ